MSVLTLLFLFACHVFSILIFLFGFLPLKSVDNECVDQSYLPSELNGIRLDSQSLYQAKAQRVILIIIDALRKDFIINENLMGNMPFLWKIQNEGIACIYTAEAHTPTVTLPRVKAMVTGSVPSFADVILNLGSPELNEDNLISQFKINGHKLIFYGDETWLKLFPTTFERFEGTTSFFVNDYTEVDLNVTRHLKQELSKTDWSVMVLHYLGLDHIGHISGPRSPLVPAKLKEMDGVIQEIFQSFHGNDTLIVICGDHGISDSGSHGGSSPAEIEVPLVFVMKGCKPDANSYMQIDITASIAMLAGLPLPKGNLGLILPGVLDSFPDNQKVYAAYVNAKSIASQDSENIEEADYQLALKLYEDWLLQGEKGDPEQIVQLFLRSAKKMSARVQANLTNFDIYMMAIGIILSLQVLFCFGLGRYPSFSNMASFSILYVICIISIAGHITACLVIGNNSALCFKEKPTLLVLFLNLSVVFLFISLNHLAAHTIATRAKVFRSAAETFLVCATVFHAFTMAASSFIEEEHQTYYYFVTTLTTILVCSNVCKNKSIMRLLGALLAMRVARTWNQTGDKWINEPDVEEWLYSPEHSVWLILSSIIGAVGIFLWIKRCLRIRHAQLVGAAGCLIAIVAYRAAIGAFGFNRSTSLGTTEASIAYASLIGIVSLTEAGSPTAITTWILLTSLLKRPHNLMLTWVQLVQYSLLQSSLQEQLSPFHCGLAHYLIGMAWYFQQGNGNNLARIDVASGYVGLPFYNAPLVGFLLSCATFSGPGLAFLLSNHTARELNQLYGFLWPRIFIVPVFFIVITSLRYHLFVWSVFSPKLLYESAISSVILLFLVEPSRIFQNKLVSEINLPQRRGKLENTGFLVLK